MSASLGRKTFSHSKSSLSENSNMMSDKEKVQRDRKKRILELNQEDAKKTALKKRSNKLFNNYLKELDPQVYLHIQSLEI